MKNKPLSILLISCLGIIVYSNTFHCSFHFDDIPSIVDNFFIKNIDLPQNIWHFWPSRFVTYYSIALNYHFNGLDVFGYHLFNLMVHVLCAILVWWLVLLTLSGPEAPLIALFAGLIFVSHPLCTQAVTYIIQRASSMATLFYLASLCFYIKSRQTKQSFYYIGSLLAAVAAMFTKEMAITLPLMILFYEYCFLKTKKNIEWKYPAPFLLTLLIIPITILSTRSIHLPGISSTHYLLTEFRVMVTYVRLCFLPIDQNLDYDYAIYNNIFAPPVLMGVVFLVIALFCAKRLFLKHRLISFSIFWFFLTLLPESSFLPITDVINEHRLYLPLVGYSIFLASVIGDSALLLKNRALSPIIAIAILIGLSILTYQRNKIWKDEFTLWSDVIQKSPQKPRAYNGRGLIYYAQGNYTQAMADFNEAIEIAPDDAEGYNNRGMIYGSQRQYAQAMADFNRAVILDPNDADAYNNLGFIYANQGNFTQAIKELNKAIEINPEYTEARKNRALCYSELSAKQGK